MVVIEQEIVPEVVEKPKILQESEALPETESSQPEDGVGSEEDCYDDALTEEQLKEITLKQAKDAKAEGNKLFGAGNYMEALSQYELALQITSDVPSSEDIRSMCYANRGVCFLKLGKYEDAIKECSKTLELDPSYLKALIRRAEAHEKLEHYEESIADLKKSMELDPSNEQARRALKRLEPLAAEKREKLKDEMIGKLKDMGNSILGKFGMNLDKFKAVKDPNSGSYSISYQQ